MIYFTSQEILESIFGALIFGLLCSLVNCVRLIFDALCHKMTGFLIFFEIILFGVGFILLSYALLDGEVRGYMVIIVFASFYLSKITICELIRKMFFRIFSAVIIFTKKH